MRRFLGLVVAPLLVPVLASAQPETVVVTPPPTNTMVSADRIVVTDDWNGPLFASGALVFAGTYGASAIVAGTDDHAGANRLYVPIVGPWLALDQWGNCPLQNPSCDTSTTDKVLLIADGVFQAAGLIAMVDALLEPTQHRVYAHTAGIHITPSHNGLMAFGHF